jgi:exodeoxyribonuclease V alpha subunit
MTLQKSQGWEFNPILLVLPETSHKLVSRELIYTGITRARESVNLW